MIKEADPEGTGVIRYAEFVKLLVTSFINWFIINYKYKKYKIKNQDLILKIDEKSIASIKICYLVNI
jgi:hypothetical protein